MNHRLNGGLPTVEMSLVLGLAAALPLVLLLAVMAAVSVRWHRRLEKLHHLAADGLLGQARLLAPQPLPGTHFEALVDALDAGDAEMAAGLFRRISRTAGSRSFTGWLTLVPAAALLAALPLLPAVLLCAQLAMGEAGYHAQEAWHTTAMGFAMLTAVLPLCLSVVTLALHLHALEAGRRCAAAASLLHHAGKELR